MRNDEDLEKCFEALKENAQLIEKDMIKKAELDPSKEKFLQDRLYRMIEYAINRHDWYDSQRYRFLEIGLALMAAGAALFTAFASLKEIFEIPILVFYCLLSIAIVTFGTGLRLVYLYNQGISRNYPYRKIADIRSWYFAYNFPSGLSDHLSSNPNVAQREVKEVVDNLKRFLDRWLYFAKENGSFLKEDLEEVFILLLLQRYRYQQVKHMSATLFYGMLFVTTLLVIALFIFIYFDVISATTDLELLQNETVSVFEIGSHSIRRL